MKHITKRNGQTDVFDETKIAKSLNLAWQSAQEYIIRVYGYYVNRDSNETSRYNDGLAYFLNTEIKNIIENIKIDNTINTSKAVTKYVIKYCNDKITDKEYWYDALALSLSLQDITHEVCGEFDLKSYKEALETCTARGIPFAGVQTIRSRYLQKDEKGKLIQNIDQSLFIVDTNSLYPIRYFNIGDQLYHYDYWNEEYKKIIRAGHFSHSTPTLLNHLLEGAKRQMSSCTQVFVEDTTEGILKALDSVCQYSRRAAGLGLHLSLVREKGANIAGRKSSGGGVVSVLKVFEQAIQHFDQQGQRGGALASYLNVLHPDIIDYLSSQDLGGQDDQRLHKIHLGVCIPDLFVRAALNNEDVYLISPTTGLYEYAGEEFEQKYNELVSKGKYIRKVSAMSLLLKMLSNQRAKSLFFFFTDSVFKETGEVHLGSNLCTEMILRTDDKYDGICNLGSVNTYKIVKDYIGFMSFDNLLEEITDVAEVCAFKLLDITQLTAIPTDKGRKFNQDIPTIGLGVMGMAQAIDLLKNRPEFSEYTIQQIQELIMASIKLGANKAKEKWEEVHNKKVGRLLTIAPTESISVILGCTSAAEFPINICFIKEINKTDIKIIYPFYKGRLAYDLSTSEQIDLAASRQQFLDHSQSINIFVTDKKYKQGVQSLRDNITKIKEDIKKYQKEINSLTNVINTLKQLEATDSFEDLEDIYIKNLAKLQDLEKKCKSEEEYIVEMEKIISDMQIDADKHISNEQMEAFLRAWKKGLYTLYYLRKEDTRHVTACESCAG